MSGDYWTQITQGLLEGDVEQTLTGTKRALEDGVEPLAVIERGLVPAMRVVGEKFSCGEYFLPNLIMAAGSMKQAMQMLEPELRSRQQTVKSPGKVVIGTVHGDIHEIGKSLVATMLAANGFEVHDLGVDVPVERFLGAVRETGATLVGLSSLLTTTMVVQKRVIEALAGAGLRAQVKVMVGGAPVTRQWTQDIGADGYAENAADAVDLALRLAAS